MSGWLTDVAGQAWDQVEKVLGGTTVTVSAGGGSTPRLAFDNPEQRRKFWTAVILALVVGYFIGKASG